MMNKEIKNWMEGLLVISRVIIANNESEEVNRLIGYCESAEAFIRNITPQDK